MGVFFPFFSSDEYFPKKKKSSSSIGLIVGEKNDLKLLPLLITKAAYVRNLVELERNNVQEKLDSCIADLESERATIGCLRREETERMMENSAAAEGLRAEISRLDGELRQARWFTALNLFIYLFIYF